MPADARCVADDGWAAVPLVLEVRVRTMSRRVLRFEVPVDDEWHEIRLGDPRSRQPLHVAARRADTVEFWAIENEGAVTIRRYFRVFATGQPDVEGAYRGTAITASGALVWHLFERTAR